ncbi:hypothetical protein PAMA_000721 [Pampus argenteus]
MDSVHFLLFVAVSACAVKVSLQSPNKERLYNNLMKSYNRMTRPVLNDSQPLTVHLGLSLMQIMDVDEKNQVLTTNLWLQLLWDDYYLQWDQSDYPGVTAVRLPDHLIWRPDILLFNSADERYEPTFRTNIVVKSSGSCTYIRPGILKSTCHIDIRWFPFDIQRCELKFGSWTYDGWSLDLKMLEADITGYTANGEWELVEVPGRKNERFYECCEEPYYDVTFTVVMRRRTLYYALNLFIPCVLISTMTLFVFLLPAESGEKISLGITVLLSLTVLMLLVAEIVPPTSDSVPLIAQYFATTMVIVGLSVIATVLVLQYHHHDPDGSKMPNWTRVFLLNWCVWFLRMKRPGVRPAYHNKAPRSSLTSMELKASTSASQPNTGNTRYVGIHGLESIPYGTAAQAGEDGVLLPTVGNVEPDLAKILEEVRYIAKRFRDQDEDKSVCNEWKFAASVIDRLCLVAFSLFTIISTIVILTSAPNFADAISKDIF